MKSSDDSGQVNSVLFDQLRLSLADQTPVAIYFGSGCIRGVVSRLEPSCLELRHDGKRSLILTHRIDAVSEG